MGSDHDRSRAGCLCCGNRIVAYETTLVSGFLAKRAWLGPPELTRMAFCDHCGFRFFERGLSPVETSALYRDYRNAEYFCARNRWEPFYTQAQHDAVVGWARSPSRLADLRKTLDRAGLPSRFRYALDHGGNDGHMLLGIDAAVRVVFDPSGRKALPGVMSVQDPQFIRPNCDLFLSCQVLEHVSNPADYLRQAASLCADGAHLYIEVPHEMWSNHVLHGRLRDVWLRFLLRHHRLLIAADMLSTGCRVKCGFLPPMGFIPMREHLNYFTNQALDSLLVSCGFEVILSGRNGEGQLFAVARKGAALRQ